MRTYSSSALFIRSFILKCIIRCHPAEVNNLSDRTGRACPAPFAYAPLAPSEARTSPFPQGKRPAILSHAPAFSARRARLQLRSSSSAVLFLFLLISLDKGQNPWPDRQPLPPSNRGDPSHADFRRSKYAEDASRHGSARKKQAITNCHLSTFAIFSNASLPAASADKF